MRPNVIESHDETGALWGSRMPIVGSAGLARAGVSLLVFRIYLPFAVAYFLSYLFRTVNAAISPLLIHELHLDASDLGLLTGFYFMSFAAAQLPLGIVLDRFGPRRVNATLLVIAAAGSAIFGLGHTLSELAVGRALIGVGVAGGLMAAMKAISIWFPPERWALINGFHLAFGGLGAIAATKPVEYALGLSDWRGLFIALGAITLAVATALFLAVPERPDAYVRSSVRQAVGGILTVFRSEVFWRLAPAAVFSQGAYLAVQALWTKPWLLHVAGMDSSTANEYLLAIALAMATGFLTSGMISAFLNRHGIAPRTTLTAAYVLFMLSHVPLVTGWIPNILIVWVVYGYFGVSAVLAFPLLTHAFSVALGGRATTCLNMLMFSFAFATQYGFGVVLDLWPRDAAGAYPAQAYSTAFGLILAMQVVSFLWMVRPLRHSTAPAG